ncbi:hypothetical protein [Marinomonas mediterranea]|jgi:hypothetical protein|uniref:DUF3857 domain-containing protein n=1 Tax=Marinomonas mediterranea (strain ATCC 700492 / JCM 21426 / NBRC 103028 / MMB-1) TaxID=717774 RepID=F2JXJ0_MARM1|nr:hypothetical protein [Marinomonas mediterranea]ADZ91890.1 hypothetical protein Marme_2659 [Marinomonas mediterranea MMB-1]WCN09843.1 hypothetical protein GV055_13415 [Marinomonas mediterranea]WCN13927.1 hypothetical protein GV054_13430 [Marinomonas mediterranea]WCN17979.1 hypothetical protein GV053_13455 [Marinomonas mediterranea MMB-1]
MKKIVSIFILFYTTALLASDDYVINTSHILYVSKSENVRAFLEPGTVLMKVRTSINDTYKRRLRVITPGGLEGEIIRRGYDQYQNITKPIAYLKRPLKIKNEQFESGAKFLVSIDDDDEELSYELTYPAPYLDLKLNKYDVKERTKRLSEAEFDYNFNLVTPDSMPHHYPRWTRSRKSPVEWGCGNSKKEESVFEIGAGGKVSAGGSFFSFFEADTYAESDNRKTITYTKNLADNFNKHRITYWKLSSAIAPRKTILNVALEKLSSCDGTKKLSFNYVIHFSKIEDIDPNTARSQKNENIDPIAINHDWVEAKKLTPGGTSPIKLTTLDDYRDLKAAFKDFKFQFSRDGYELNSALLQFVMMMTANISLEYKRSP